MPTQTYTPSAVWNNTSQYQENGDVSDGTILQLTGEDAMDNIAYLTGSNTESAVRRIATVADLAALKALTTQRDQDYFVLDSNKRVYQYDSGSAATGDDYAVVQPSAGGGRYILTNVVPITTSLRRVRHAVTMPFTDTGGSTGWVPASGRVTCNGGGTVTLVAQFDGLMAGDLISGIELASNANAGGGGADVVAIFYSEACNSGSSTPTVTALGTLTQAAGSSGIQSSTAAPLPITIPSPTSTTSITVVITCSTGASTTSYIYWVAINGTRSYMTGAAG